MSANIRRGLAIVLALTFLAQGATAEHEGVDEPVTEPVSIEHLGLSFPVTFVQTAIMLGDCSTYHDDTPSLFTKILTFFLEQKVARATMLGNDFDGLEATATRLETPAARKDVREVSEAMRRASLAAGRRLSVFLSTPRLPGFYFSEDILAQPANYRAVALKSDGSAWTRYPPPFSENESRISVSGATVDLANKVARGDLLTSLRSVYRADCPGDPGACIGPVSGFATLNEWKLTPLYLPFGKGIPEAEDLEPHGSAEDCTPLPAGVDRVETCRYLPLDSGHPFDQFTDEDPVYSALQPPKRAMPLFSENAAEDFLRYAATRGVLTVEHDGMTIAVDALPADRGEFNRDCGEISASRHPWLEECSDPELPPWVKFVPDEAAGYWSLWEDWVYETWTGFAEEVARAMVEAQSGNDEFQGVLYFQLPAWYSIRASALEPVTYRYCCDEGGGLATETVILANHPDYGRFNPVVMGVDLDRIAVSPWFVGFIHETSHVSLWRPPAGSTRSEAEEWTRRDGQYRVTEIAKGALAKRLAHRNGKLFGAFARSQYLADGAILQPADFERAWDDVIEALAPDIVATIPPGYYIENPDLGDKGELGAIWLEKKAEYTSSYPDSALHVSFGDREIASGSSFMIPDSDGEVSLILTVANAGAGVLTLGQPSIAGSVIGTLGQPPRWVAPGDSVDLTVSIAGGGEGSRDAVISFDTNDPENPRFTVSITISEPQRRRAVTRTGG